MALGSSRIALGVICALALATGCTSPPKKASPSPGADQKPGAPPPKQAPAAAPAKDKGVLASLQSVPLKLQAGDKVWVVPAEGLKPRDARVVRNAEEALRRLVVQRDKAVLLDGSAPPLAETLSQFQARPAAEIPDADLVAAARKAGATKVVVFRAVAAPPADEPAALIIRTLDASSGNVLAVAEVGSKPPAAAAPEAAAPVQSGRAYPLRITDPEYVSRPDVAPAKQESKLFGRRWRAFSRFSDAVGPQGLYDDQNYQAWTRANDQLGPFPFYDVDTSQVIITTTPPNARVFVNEMDRGLTPCWLPIEYGDKVVLVKEGYIAEEFRVPEKKSSIHVDLRPR